MAGEKSFAPTATKIRRSRADGNRPATGDAAGLCATLAALCTIGLQGESSASALRSLWRGISFAANNEAAHGTSVVLPTPLLVAVGAQTARSIATVCITYIIVLIGATFLLGGAGYTRLRCDFSKMQPAKNAKRLFSKSNALTAVRGATATAVIGWVLFSHLPEHALAIAGAQSPAGMLRAAEYCGTHILALTGGLGLLFALFEWRVNAIAWLKKLRMDFSEIKREHREQNGDPYQKSRRKKIARRMQRSRRVPLRRASVVIVNPTHIAIALYYQPPEDAVPLVIAMGAEHAAQRIRETARTAGIPIVESIATARALFAQAEEGEPIPIELYGLVAPIIAGVLAGEQL